MMDTIYYLTIFPLEYAMQGVLDFFFGITASYGL